MEKVGDWRITLGQKEKEELVKYAEVLGLPQDGDAAEIHIRVRDHLEVNERDLEKVPDLCGPQEQEVDSSGQIDEEVPTVEGRDLPIDTPRLPSQDDAMMDEPSDNQHSQPSSQTQSAVRAPGPKLPLYDVNQCRICGRRGHWSYVCPIKVRRQGINPTHSQNTRSTTTGDQPPQNVITARNSCRGPFRNATTGAQPFLLQCDRAQPPLQSDSPSSYVIDQRILDDAIQRSLDSVMETWARAMLDSVELAYTRMTEQLQRRLVEFDRHVNTNLRILQGNLEDRFARQIQGSENRPTRRRDREYLILRDQILQQPNLYWEFKVFGEDIYQLVPNHNRTRFRWKIYVPKSSRQELIREMHEHPILGRRSVEETIERVKMDHCWPDANVDIRHYIDRCPQCQGITELFLTRNQ